MKSVLVTQRVQVLADRGERRDALDQRLAAFLWAAGFLPVPVPNTVVLANALYHRVKPHAVCLSGGNDLAELGGDAPERDATEGALVDLAERHGLPVFGVCRGFQFLAHRRGGRLSRLEGHVGTRHELQGSAGARHVNSFHNWSVTSLGEGWQVRASTPDGSIEFAACPALRQLGIMWHPEREPEFQIADLEIIRHFISTA
jgi:putative glutamine amidotransferase